MLEYRQFQWKRYHCVAIPTLRRTLIFSQLSWKVRRGQMILILGNNGAGKSTLLRAAAGILEPVEGEIIYHLRQQKGVLEGLPIKPMLVSDKTSFFYRELTVRWNMRIWAILNCLSEKIACANIRYITDMFDLHNIQDRTVMSLSSGQYQRFSVAIKLLTQPDLLLLDEPWRSIDDKTCEILMGRIYEYIRSDDNRSMIMASPSSDYIKRYNALFFDQVVEIKNGDIIL